MITVCRLCLSSSAKYYKTIAEIEEDYFQLILPDIDIQLVQSPMFCQSCADLLQITYSFKSTCIKTEKILKLYALNCGGKKLLPSDVLQSNCLEQNQIQSGNIDADASLNKYIKEEYDNDSFGCDLDSPDDLQTCRGSVIKHQEALKQHSIEEVVDEDNNSDKHMFDRQYKCGICEKEYKKKQYLLDHIRIHFTKSNCNLCGKRCYNVGAVKRHLLLMHQMDTGDDVGWRDHISVLVDVLGMEEALKQHSKLYEMDHDENKFRCNKDQLDRAYKCNICDKIYQEKKFLPNHIRLHFTKTHCNLCGNLSCNVAALKRHLSSIHQIDVSNDITWRDHIAVTVNTTEMEQALKQHDKLGEIDDEIKSDSYNKQLKVDKTSIASALYNYRCETCRKQFRAKSSLNRHKIIHGVKKYSICNYCQKKFETKDRLKKHISACHHNLICDTCGYTTTKKNNFMEHKRIHTGDKPYTCNLCNKSFVQSSSLGTHMRTVHSTERLFTCEYCSKSFKVKGSLTKHILEVHLIDKIEKKFICNYCGKKYRLQHLLNRHLKWHKADRPFKCNMCEKAFVAKDTLRKHRLTHLAEKKHKCEICGKGFHQKYNIKIHMKVHGTQ